MTRMELEAVAQGITPILREAVAVETARLLKRIGTLEDTIASLLSQKQDQIDALHQRMDEIDNRPAVKGLDGKDADPAHVAALVAEHVAAAVAAIPIPKDGKSITVADVEPLIDARVFDAVKSIAIPRDGVGLTGAVIDRDGHLVLTLSDGAVKDVGGVVGQSVDQDEVNRLIIQRIADMVAALPKPKDGEKGDKGDPGKDGTLENVKVVQVNERTWAFAYKDGQRMEGGELYLASVPLDRGVYQPGKAYEAGDGVTLGGSWWLAQKATTARPGTNEGADEWRLAVKKGADGKGIKGDKGEPGVKGKDGLDGRSWPR